MSSTLTTHPPQPSPPESVAPELPRLTSRRPSALDRLALRVGVMLITYGRRHTSAPPRRNRPARTVVHAPDRAWDSAGWLPRPGA